MAIALLGPLVDKIKGSVKGVTFQPLGVYQIVKGKARTNRPNSDRQLPSLVLMSQYAPLWRTLTQPQRDAWIAYASTCGFVNSLGITYQCNGSQMYFRSALFYNSRLTPTIFDAPTNTGLPTVPIIGFDYSAGDIRITTLTPAPPANTEIRGTVWNSTPPTRLNPQGATFAQFVWAADALPFVIATGVDAALATGLLRRAHITWRYADEFQRVSSNFRQRFSYTTV